MINAFYITPPSDNFKPKALSPMFNTPANEPMFAGDPDNAYTLTPHSSEFNLKVYNALSIHNYSILSI